MILAARLTRNTAGILAALLAVRAVPLRAQDRQAPVIRTTTRLVQLNVVVMDKHGRPVSDLSQNDFEVFDNGLEQKLSHFSVASTPVAGPGPAAETLALTNRPEQPGETPGSVTIVLVDELIAQDIRASNDYRAVLQSARLQVLKFLSALQPGQQVALYALRLEGVVVLHDLTDDSAALITAAKKIGAGQLKTKIPAVGPKPETAVRTSEAAWSGAEMTAVRKTGITEDLLWLIVKEAFQSLARHLQGTPVRKNVVWISPKFPPLVTGLDPKLMAGERDAINPIPGAMLPVPEFANTESYNEQSRAMAHQMSNANISLYPMDTKGLMTGSVVNLQGERNFIQLLASETGGRAFYDRNTLNEDLRKVVEESRVSYLLGYYPGDGAWDGKYHHVEVKLQRAGLSILCRKGYFASDELLPQNPDNVLRDAAKSMLESSGIGVTLNVSSNPLEWFQQEVVVKLDTREIHFENRDGRWRAQMDVAFVQLANDGRVVEGVKDHLELALYPDTYNEAVTEGWFYPKSLYVNPEAEKLRVVVCDLATGAVGSVSLPIYHRKA